MSRGLEKYKDATLREIIPRSPFILGVICAGVLLHSACQSRFIGTSVSPAPESQEKPGLSPDEGEKATSSNPVDPPPQEPSPPEVCFNRHKAARLYFVVDNSNSHGYLKSESNVREGTDPVRTQISVRGRLEPKTYRQEALYTILKRTIELDRRAKSSDPKFLGTELGVAFFPRYRGDGNPSNRYPGELEDLSQYVPVTGTDGTAASLFPDRITSLDAISGTPAAVLDDLLWTAFNFTHSPGGSTPYATGLRSAVENLLPAASNPSDPRENIVFFLTDGLPTDETPSNVIRLRSQLGEKTRFIILSVYDPNEDPSVTSSPLYDNLKSAFLGSTSWATKPGNIDFYPKTEAGFQRYWTDLIAIPEKISETLIQVSSADKLSGELDRILESTTTCRR